MINKYLAAAALLAATCGPASAVTLVGSQTHGGTTVTDYSGAGLLSFDIDLASTASARIDYAIDLADLASPIIFNATVRNFTSTGLNRLSFTLDTSGFDSIGSVTRSFGGSTAISKDSHGATLVFKGPEFLDLFIGDPLADGSGTDWTIDSSLFQAGDRLSITVAVPEPESYALLLAGLGVVAMMSRRKRRK